MRDSGELPGRVPSEGRALCVHGVRAQDLVNLQVGQFLAEASCHHLPPYPLPSCPGPPLA